MTNPLHITPELTLIPLDQPLEGFTSFIGAWLHQGKRTLLVDVGPSSTVDPLCSALDELGVTRLDALLLTHIHIDHAGGAGSLVKRFPDTPVICHPKAIPHLANPEKLWQGSLKTLGDTARAYGPISPTPKEMLVSSEDFTDFGVRPLATPGHAVHHVSYFKDSILFAGEAGGVCMEIPGKGIWMRPATPPKFVLEISLSSLDRLIKAPHGVYCYGHFGAVLHNNKDRLTKHREQLLLWAEVIQECIAQGEGDMEERCLTQLLKRDPCLALHDELPQAIRRREKSFMINSIRGVAGYLREKAATR